MLKKILVIIFSFLIALVVFAYLGLKDTALQGSAFAAKNICSGVFVSRMPADTIYEQAVVPASPPLAFASYQVENQAQWVSASIFGMFTRKAQFRPGLGCTLIPEGKDLLAPSDFVGSNIINAAPNEEVEMPAVNQNAALAEALATGFSENDSRGLKNTKAIVVLHRGQVVAEHYSPDVTAETPLLGWSMTKSITNMLVGILVRQGKLDVQDSAPVNEWQNDNRKTITTNHLLHMSSGLEFNETYGMNTDVTQMITQQDSAGTFAANKPLVYSPGEFWDYSSGTSNILARIVHDKVGGSLGLSQAFVKNELFLPLGIQSSFLEPDPAGAFIGSSFLYLSARNWAKLGQLMLQDGVWKDERILPEGWVDYSVTPTPANTNNAYGAHFWLNLDPSDDNKKRRWPDVPTDAYSMNGYQGQHVVIIPSHDMVVVRLGFTPNPARPGMNRLLKDIIAALPSH